MNNRLETLDREIKSCESTPLKRKYQKELNDLKKKQVELVTFDEKLRHEADKKITIDLDDGVKVNYGKFGSLLAEVKKVTGKK